MKKIIIQLLIITTVLILCSCSDKNTNETYFIHAVGFEYSKDNNKYTVNAVCETLKQGSTDYFLISADDKSPEKAVNKLMKKYRDCYFATAKLYVISNQTDEKAILAISKEICDSNILPSKSSVIGTTDKPQKDFLKVIKNNDDLSRIMSITEKEETNCISLFSRITSGQTVILATFKQDGDEKIVKSKSISIKLSQEVLS